MLIRKKRKSTPEATSALLPSVFKRLRIEDLARGFQAQQAFARAVGPTMAARARAEKLRGSTLYVRVASGPWAHQLHALKAELLEKLRRTPGGEVVTDLRFVVGAVESVPGWEAPRKSAQPRAATHGTAQPEPLSDELVRALADVRDEELRASLMRAAGLRSRR
jgi:predicted nucleic acid-binding Zn ribbon protein